MFSVIAVIIKMALSVMLLAAITAGPEFLAVMMISHWHCLLTYATAQNIAGSILLINLMND